MRLLLDTHAFLWFVWDDPQLSPAARAAIESIDNEIFSSVATPWEVAIKISTGKLAIGQDVEPYFTEHLAGNQITVLPILLSHADTISRLPFHHKDPFDRLLVAQSLVENMPVLSADTILDAYGVNRLW